MRLFGEEITKEKKMKNAIERCMSVSVMLFLGMITIAMLPIAASAQDQTFMLVPGIPGSSLDAHHERWIDVSSLRQTWNATAKKHSACEIEIGKGLDVAGPRLWTAAVTSQLFPELRIEVWGRERRAPKDLRNSARQRPHYRHCDIRGTNVRGKRDD
jgi:hypothetical protein